MKGPFEKQKRLHHEVTHVGLRAQATAVGLIQLCIELCDSKVLSENGLSRIKQAICDELLVGPYRRHASRDDLNDVQTRIDRIFAGKEKIGPADELAFMTDE